MTDLSLAAATVAGVVYFASPCCWPLYPAYLSVLAGGMPAEAVPRRVFGRALAFVAGLSAVFVAWGAAASGIGQLLRDYWPVLGRLAGVGIAALGMHQLGWLSLPLPGGPLAARRAAPVRSSLGAFAAGVAFGFGWTPCTVPVLGAILLLASSTATLERGVTLLLAFSLGFAVPFLLLASVASRLAGRLPAAGPALVRVQRAAGYGLVALGTLVYFGALNRLSAWLFYAIR